MPCFGIVFQCIIVVVLLFSICIVLQQKINDDVTMFLHHMTFECIIILLLLLFVFYIKLQQKINNDVRTFLHRCPFRTAAYSKTIDDDDVFKCAIVILLLFTFCNELQPKKKKTTMQECSHIIVLFA
jgi:hypothetical protein